MALFRGLSGRLLILTVTVVMLVEVAIFVPSVAKHRLDYLQDRVTRAYIAGLAMLAAPRGMVPEDINDELVATAGVLNIVLVRDGRRSMMMSRGPLPMVAATHDIRDPSPVELVTDALRGLVSGGGTRVIRVIGHPPGSTDAAVEITLEEGPLREALLSYGLRILQLSLMISLITAAMVFLVMRLIVVSPLRALARNVRAFRDNPEDPARVLPPTRRNGELGEVERALAAMQEEVQRSLRERRRLASLGEALAKISHDLRNMLASLQLMVDRLGHSSDPLVGRVLPKMIGSLDRAISLCQRTLTYGKAEESPPDRRPVRLAALAQEVCEGLGLDTASRPVAAMVEVGPEVTVHADPEQLYRVLANLVRNAAEAITASGCPGSIAIEARQAADSTHVLVRDTGPGLPDSARTHLFEPFRGAARRGGTGLGLAIARELVTAHGGRLELVESTPEGSTFRIVLPATDTA